MPKSHGRWRPRQGSAWQSAIAKVSTYCLARNHAHLECCQRRKKRGWQRQESSSSRMQPPQCAKSATVSHGLALCDKREWVGKHRLPPMTGLASGTRIRRETGAILREDQAAPTTEQCAKRACKSKKARGRRQAGWHAGQHTCWQDRLAGQVAGQAGRAWWQGRQAWAGWQNWAAGQAGRADWQGGLAGQAGRAGWKGRLAGMGGRAG